MADMTAIRLVIGYGYNLIRIMAKCPGNIKIGTLLTLIFAYLCTPLADDTY